MYYTPKGQPSPQSFALWSLAIYQILKTNNDFLLRDYRRYSTQGWWSYPSHKRWILPTKDSSIHYQIFGSRACSRGKV